MEIPRKSENRQFESCVLCGQETEYAVTDSISLRKYYVDGAGQLCKECFKRFDKGKENSNEDKIVSSV